MSQELNINQYDFPRLVHHNELVDKVEELSKRVEDLLNEVININHPNPIMTKAEVAELFRVDVRTISNWMSDKKIPYYELDNGHPRFVREEVMRILKKPNQKMFDPKKSAF